MVDTSIANDSGSGSAESLHLDYARCQLSPADVDIILSKELLKLSIGDRNAIDEEIHGVRTMALEESPELLEAALLKFSEEIDNTSDQNPLKAAYIKSQDFEHTYVNKEDFRLRFLRSEFFDARKAAIRLMKFLNVAVDLIGREALWRPIRCSDLKMEEMKCMRTGPVQILPYRDRSGRPILTWVDDFDVSLGNKRVRAKMVMLLLYAMSDDVESQQKGFAAVCWPGSNQISCVPDISEFDIMSNLMDGIPIRNAVNHFCLPDKPHFHIMRTMFAIIMPSKNGSRLKIHVGEPIELQYVLRSFGISFELIPVTGTGNVKTAYHRQWIRRRKTLDIARAKENGEDFSIIEIPRSADVIFRTGNSLTCHPGNSMFQNVMEAKMEEHATASQVEKMSITNEIIADINCKNGRFLQWDKRGWWVQIEGKSQIHAKVAVSVRDFKSKPVAKQNRQVCYSSTSVFQNQDGKRRKTTHNCGSDSHNSFGLENRSSLPSDAGCGSFWKYRL